MDNATDSYYEETDRYEEELSTSEVDSTVDPSTSASKIPAARSFERNISTEIYCRSKRSKSDISRQSTIVATLSHQGQVENTPPAVKTTLDSKSSGVARTAATFLRKESKADSLKYRQIKRSWSAFKAQKSFRRTSTHQCAHSQDAL